MGDLSFIVDTLIFLINHKMEIDSYILKDLEESLWRTETRFDRSYMEKVLAPDFFEFGRSGNRYSREDILSQPMEEINAKLPLKDFKIHEIASDVVLVTYISEVTYDSLEVSNRSSLWIKTPAGWQIKFHQGTPAT